MLCDGGNVTVVERLTFIADAYLCGVQSAYITHPLLHASIFAEAPS